MPSRWSIELRRAWARLSASTQLRWVSGPRDHEPPLVAFGVMRNEMLRLPRFLSYYRELGVSRFVIVENNSTDETRAFLAAQPDVCLYTSTHHFGGKAHWIDHLLRKHGAGRWCLVADADELLVYPESDRVNLPELCRYLDGTHTTALHAILLDLYPKGALAKVNYVPGSDYGLHDWYFDPFDTLSRTPRHFYRGTGLDYRFHGGVRRRLFQVSPCLSKFPLFRHGRDTYLTDGQHSLEGADFSTMRAVLFHFKYLQDFEAHAREEVRRGQHIGAENEYRAYAETADRQEQGLEIWDENSIRLEDNRQLERLGFLVRPNSYDEFAATVPPREP